MFLARYNPPCFFDQCVGELILRNFTDHFALAEQQPLIFPSGNARSASRASPGPLTTHPITAIVNGWGRSFNRCSTSSAISIRLIWQRPQVGQLTKPARAHAIRDF